MPSEASPPVPLSLTGEGERMRRDLAEVEATFFRQSGYDGSPLARQGEGDRG
jgi:hypothetical protein